MYLSGQKEIGESVNVHPSSPLPLMLQRVVVVGGADRSVRLYSLHGDGRELARWTLPAPVLSLSTHGSVVCAGCMDGQSVVIDVEAVAAAAAASDKSVEIPVLDLNEECCVEYRLLRRQAKYVICTQFSPDGLLLTTLAHDHSLHVYAAEQAASLSSWTHIATCTLASAADSLAYLPCPGITGLQWWRLVVALRDHTHLHSACLPELPAESTPVLLRMVPFVSLNERVWDTHAGMQPLLLRTSADHLHLAVSTDKSLAFVLDVSYSGATSDAVMASEQEQQRRAQRLYLLSGHSCGSLCRPQLEWDAYGTYLYGSSEGDTAVLVWGVGSGAPQRRVPIARLVGHKGVVRGIATHRSESITVTVAFDHKLIVWGPETDVSV